VKRALSLVLVMMLMLSLVGCGGSNNQSQPEAPSEQQSEQPKQNVKITLYTSEPQDLVNDMINDFKSKNPGIDVEIFRSGSGQVISKMEAEMEVGDTEANVIWFADIDYFRSLAEKGLLEEYRSPEADDLSEIYIYEGGKYYEVRQIFNIIGYNTARVKEEDAPKTWGDLTKPALKSKVSIANPNYSGAAFITLATLTNDDKVGWDFYEGLKENDVKFEQSNGNLITKLSSGEYWAVSVVDFMVRNAKADGSPVESVWPSDGAVLIPTPVAIMSTSSDEEKEAAKKLIDYLLSMDGQKFFIDQGYIPVKAAAGAPEGAPNLSDIKIVPLDMDYISQNRTTIRDRYAELFGTN